MIRKISGVVIGYAIFVITSVVLFRFSGRDPHQAATLGFQIFTIIYGSLFSCLSGFVLQVVAKTKNLQLNFILAFVIAGFATFSLLKSGGSHWTQLLAIFIFAPCSVFGGWFYARQSLKKL